MSPGPPGDPERLEIRDLEPQLASGRPTKTIAGDPVVVSATVVSEWRGPLRAELQFRRDSDTQWQTTEMAHAGGSRYEGTFTANTIGVHAFRVRAFADVYGAWARDLAVRADAGQALDVHFGDGASVIENLLDHAPAADQSRLVEAIKSLRDSRCSDSVRLAAGLDDAAAAALCGVVDPGAACVSSSVIVRCERERAVRGSWYEMFPRTYGGFAEGSQLWDRLRVVADSGFDVVYLAPIHPIGISNRKGPGNSLIAGPDDPGCPWAIGDPSGGHDSIHADLGTLDEFDHFVAGAAEMGVEIALDFALQCSPDHPWVSEHPEWFARRSDDSIRFAENPPKTYEDIYPLNFWPESTSDRESLWNACADILEFWITHSIKVFRVDNPHTKPVAFWEWLIPEIQHRHPEVVFLAEAFTGPAMMHTLAEVGFSQSYTYFTWRESADELRAYAEELAHGPMSGIFRPNLWPNTPDILNGPLRNGTEADFMSRALLAATLSPSWGIYSGYELCENEPASPGNTAPEHTEYRHSEKYEIKHRDHLAANSLMGWLARLNRIRSDHESMHRMHRLRFHWAEDPNVLAYSYYVREDIIPNGAADRVLVIANTKPNQAIETTVHLDMSELGLAQGARFGVVDELSGHEWVWSGPSNYVKLDPAERVGHIFAISGE